MSRLRFTCRWCRCTFMGRDAVQNWSRHTWVHWDEISGGGAA